MSKVQCYFYLCVELSFFIFNHELNLGIHAMNVDGPYKGQRIRNSDKIPQSKKTGKSLVLRFVWNKHTMLHWVTLQVFVCVCVKKETFIIYFRSHIINQSCSNTMNTTFTGLTDLQEYVHLSMASGNIVHLYNKLSRCM